MHGVEEDRFIFLDLTAPTKLKSTQTRAAGTGHIDMVYLDLFVGIYLFGLIWSDLLAKINCPKKLKSARAHRAEEDILKWFIWHESPSDAQCAQKLPTT